MTIASGAALMGRKQAESQMISAGIIRRANGLTAQDPATLVESPLFDVILTSKCKLRMASTQPGAANVPGQQIATDQAILSLPVDGSGMVRTGDVWECTANPLDVSLVGRKMRIAGVHAQSFATARRFTVEETS